jgi:hypothetical protein
VVEGALEFARRLGDADVVRDHLAEVLWIGQQPAVRSVDDRAVHPRRDAQRLE